MVQYVGSVFYIFLYAMSVTMKAFFRMTAAAFKSEAEAQAVSGIIPSWHLPSILADTWCPFRYLVAWSGHLHVCFPRFWTSFYSLLICRFIVVILFLSLPWSAP